MKNDTEMGNDNIRNKIGKKEGSPSLFNPINKLINNRIIVNGIAMTIQEFRALKEGVK